MKMQLHSKQIITPGLPTLVLLHGFLGSYKDWEPFFSDWQQYFSIIAIDLPGHGNSLLKKNNLAQLKSFEDITNIISETIKSESFYLLGYSMGGRLAFHMAHCFPHRVKKLVCVSGMPGISNTCEAQKRLEHDQKLLKDQKNKKKFLLSWYKQTIFKGVVEHTFFENFLQQRMSNSFSQMQQGLNLMSIGRQPDMWQWLLSEKTLPILYICGTEDEKYNNVGQTIQKNNPFINVKFFSGCSHMPQFQARKDFCELVIDFLQK